MLMHTEFPEKESDQKFRLLLDGVKDYDFILLDTGGVVTTWERGPACITVYTAGELIGQHISRIVTFQPLAATLSGSGGIWPVSK